MQVVVILLAIALVICLYIMWVVLLFNISYYLFPIASVAFIGAVLFNYVRVVYDELLIGKGWIDSPAGDQPAYKQYYFRKAYPDYQLVVKASYFKNLAMVEKIVKTGFLLFKSGWIALALWPLGITYYLIVAVGVLAGVCAYVVFGLLHLSIVLTCMGLVYTAAFVLWSYEHIQRLWQNIHPRCPHSDCHEPIDLPHYDCSECGVRHKNLIPGSYGVRYRQCQCGAWLPTLYLFGRNRLPSFCPHPKCGKPLNSGSQITRNLLIPIAGAVDSGKTSYLISSMVELHRLANHGRASIAFPEQKYESLYKRSERNFLRGVGAAKTVEESPDAFQINVNTGGSDRLLYIYDAAGELFQRSDSLLRQVYYPDIHGLVFLIDPFSLSQLQNTLENELKNAESQIRPSAERPQDTYDKLMQVIHKRNGAGQTVSKQPLAVVVTKADALGVGTQIEEVIASQPPLENDATHTPESDAVRTWLKKNGEGNLVRAMETNFKDVAYFYCSPLGRLPDATSKPFTPKGVLDPLGWLLNKYGLDFKNGTAAKPITETKTATVTPYKARVSAPGETVNGQIIAVLWGISVLALFIVLGVILAIVYALSS
jgi:hypothetical protein